MHYFDLMHYDTLDEEKYWQTVICSHSIEEFEAAAKAGAGKLGSDIPKEIAEAKRQSEINGDTSRLAMELAKFHNPDLSIEFIKLEGQTYGIW